MPKSKRAINPADALRKAQRKRELKKNKEQRREARQSALAKKNTNPIRAEIQRLENQGKSTTRHTGLDKNAQARLTQLKADLERIEKAKKTREPQLSGAQAAFLERQRQQQEREQRENRKMVYDPKTNSFVAVKVKDTGAKAGSSKTRRSDGDSSSSSSTSSSDTDSDSDMSDSDLSDMEDMETKQEDEEDMNEDEDIPLPEGPPPTDSKAADQSKEEDDDEDDDDIPLPEGPPPPKPFQTQLAPIQAAQMRPPPPPPPRPPHFTPQFHGMPMAGSYGMMVPPPPPPGRPPAHAMRVPPPPPPSRPPFTQRPPMYTQPAHIYQSSSTTTTTTEKSAVPESSQVEVPKPTREQIAAATISAEPQLRDLQKELLGFVPAAVRRKQAAQKKTAALPKGAKPVINAAPDVEEEQD
ncbi:hypothetical protein LRAMOSA01619 [Lichtheimia ramosa]|uniref:Wbp11/ELF5/Saf1 N-terminal domain-containing protein n=1 Tax=Lichtheimia ramosa TaxID=688394 RepID=A0A077WJW0_9FUNG|nr:hypothetical protein LRAMOSA01619 [Lichtheimia ramosa]